VITRWDGRLDRREEYVSVTSETVVHCSGAMRPIIHDRRLRNAPRPMLRSAQETASYMPSLG